jgi:hypothetical protein
MLVVAEDDLPAQKGGHAIFPEHRMIALLPHARYFFHFDEQDFGPGNTHLSTSSLTSRLRFAVTFVRHPRALRAPPMRGAQDQRRELGQWTKAVPAARTSWTPGLPTINRASLSYRSARALR